MTTDTAWGAQALWETLRQRLPGLSVEVVTAIGSTNSELLDRIRAGGAAASRRASDFQPCLLVAEQQTAGRGRHGRHWHAERGRSLTFSLSLPLQRADWSGLSLAIGLALAEALEPASASAPRIGR